MLFTLNFNTKDPLFKKKSSYIGKSNKFSVGGFDSPDFKSLLYFLRIRNLKSETELDSIIAAKSKGFPMISKENEQEVIRALVGLYRLQKERYPRSAFEDLELLQSGTDLSQNIRNSLVVTLEEKTVIQSMLDSLK